MDDAMSTRVLLLGAHSALNLGDDAIMHQTLKYLKEVFPSADITVAANDPQSWQRYAGPDVHILSSLTSCVVDRTDGSWRWRKGAVVATAARVVAELSWGRMGRRFGRNRQDDLGQLLSAYAAADRVYVCGGGNLYANRHLSVAFLWLVFTIAISVWLRKPTMMLPQSVGPVPGRIQQMVLRWLVEHMDLVTVREAESCTFLDSLGCRVSPVILPDLAFGLPPTVREVSHPSEFWLGLTVMDFGAQNAAYGGQQAYEDAIVEAIGEVMTLMGSSVRVFLFAQCFGPSRDQDDRACSRRVYERLCVLSDSVHLVEREDDPFSLRQCYSEMDCLIGTRMHTAIFAAGGGVPLILIAYQPKAIGTMQLLGLGDYVCRIQDLTRQRLGDLLASARKHQATLSLRIRQRYLDLNAELDLIREYLGSPG